MLIDGTLGKQDPIGGIDQDAGKDMNTAALAQASAP
jgi:phosphatidate phosphatase PAH1